MSLDSQAPADWSSISGRRSRQLLRNIEHTDAVHGFVATLAEQARSQGWEVAQLDPPIRAARYFRYGDKLRSIHPDAFGILRKSDDTWPFFLEWERRAVRPTTMAARLAPYLATTPPTVHRRPRYAASRPRGLPRRPGRDPLSAGGQRGIWSAPGSKCPSGSPTSPHWRSRDPWDGLWRTPGSWEPAMLLGEGEENHRTGGHLDHLSQSCQTWYDVLNMEFI